MTREMALEAMKKPPPGGYFVWDGKDEDDRPLTHEEMRAGIALAKKRGRPAGSGTKEQVAIRLDKDVLSVLRATGDGWQTRVNQILRERFAL
jgi:uncharacterized protein (DUF4415 family)